MDNAIWIRQTLAIYDEFEKAGILPAEPEERDPMDQAKAREERRNQC